MAYGIKVNGVDIQDVFTSSSDVGGNLGGNLIYGWGQVTNAENGLFPGRTIYTPTQASNKAEWLKISSSGGGVMTGIKVDGSLWVWGKYNTDIIYTPKKVGTDTWKDVVGTTLLKSDNTIWWLTSMSTVTQFSGDTDWSSISATAAIKSNGTLWTWGDNTYGQLGIWPSGYKSSPTQVGSLTNWKQVSSGAYHNAAIKTDGTLWAWGYNIQGQLGVGHTTSVSSPVQVGLLTNWKSVFADRSYNTFAIKTDGTLWSWGNNGWAELGTGVSGGGRSSPVQVGSINTWKTIYPSAYQFHGITTDGTLYGWGNNSYGGVGNGSTYNQAGLGMTVINIKNCVGVAEGQYGACALQQI